MSGWILPLTLIAAVTGPQQASPVAPEPVAYTVNWFYQDAKRNFLAAAELMPAEHYDFRPTPEVRSFGQIVGHIANWQFTNCAAARGEPNPNKEDFEKTPTRMAAVAGLEAAYAYCDEVFRTLDADRLSARSGGGAPVMFRAMSALAHPYLHYGNLVTYLRLKGLTPPSTSGARLP
jgi:uncharacterized damage-inducible protein DinB